MLESEVPQPTARIFPTDGLEAMAQSFWEAGSAPFPPLKPMKMTALRHTMPAGVCSYCVGEQRVGTAFQQGVVGKIDFKEEFSWSI